jgi:Fe-S oxidoreductase
VDIPLKPDEELENTEIKPEVAAEKKERVEETPLKLEEESEDVDEGVEGMKVEQGPKGLLGAYWISYHNPCHLGTHKGPANLRWNR